MPRTRFFQSHKQPVRHSILFRNTPDEELNLALIPHGHLKALADGRGGEEEYLTVVFRIMVGASLIAFADEDDRKMLEREIFLPALSSLIAVGERKQRLNRFGFSGDELTGLKQALNLTDDLQKVTTRRQQLEMYEQVQGFVGGFSFTLKNLHILQGKFQ
jgi:hypothetical protein